jgi:hydroxyacylglutathione hydrolase
MILRQFLHTDPVAISHLFGCGGKACGAVVDPLAEVGRDLDAARDAGLKILYVFDTHIHADHVSTGRPMAEVVGDGRFD